MLRWQSQSINRSVIVKKKFQRLVRIKMSALWDKNVILSITLMLIENIDQIIIFLLD
jgi:hypothetical protein